MAFPLFINCKCLNFSQYNPFWNLIKISPEIIFSVGNINNGLSPLCFTSKHTLENMDFYLFDTDFLQYNHCVPCPPTDSINRPDKTELDSGTPDGITKLASCHSFRTDTIQ